MLHLERGPGRGLFLLTLGEAGRNEESYICKLAACRNPYCDCNDMTLSLTPRSPSSKARWSGSVRIEVTVDPFHRSHEPRPAETADARVAAFGHAIASDLGDEHWTMLARIFLGRKRMAIKSLDPDRDPCPFPYDAVEKRGELVSYLHVFPFAKPVTAEHGGKKFIVDDQHCLNPGCDCTEVVLPFFPMGAGKEPVRARCTVRLDLGTGSWTDERTGERPRGEAAALGQALADGRVDLAADLGARRTLLRRVYAASKARLYREPPPRAAAAPGRNDPCPCGSGRKYKHCCRGRVPAG